MSDKYRINPNFVVPDPTPADFFCTVSEGVFTEEFKDKLLEGWRDDGCSQVRLTLVNEEHNEGGYPHGVWIEGWRDMLARQLPFGAPWPKADSAIYPPLVDEPPRASTDLLRGG